MILYSCIVVVSKRLDKSKLMTDTVGVRKNIFYKLVSVTFA